MDAEAVLLTAQVFSAKLKKTAAWTGPEIRQRKVELCAVERKSYSEEYDAMPVYPNYGAIKKIGDVIVVKLS